MSYNLILHIRTTFQEDRTVNKKLYSSAIHPTYSLVSDDSRQN